MYFNSENSRDAYKSAPERLREIFPEASGNIDAEYLSADRSHVMGISSLPIYAPICVVLFGSAEFLDYADSLEGDFLLVYGDTVTESGKAVPENIEKIVKDAVDAAIKGVGTLNEKGEHTIDLKGLHVGNHYPINLLLGNRIGFENFMLTTPKSALDAFGRGAFRAGADAQVLASRYVYNADEAGEPANRQFYIVENNRQIFYSADVKNNVKSAKCTHKSNHTVIEYETECGLKITRTIFILPQYKGMPEAVEAQLVTVENTGNTERSLKIVMTGVLATAGPDAIFNDVLYSSIIHESAALKNDKGQVIALSPNLHPRYARHSRRFATMFIDGEAMDEYCVSYPDFIGSGDLMRPENLAHLTSRPAKKAANFFAMAKKFDVAGGETKSICEMVGFVHDNNDSLKVLDAGIETLYKEFRFEDKLLSALEDVKTFYRNYSSYLTVKSDDKDLDSYINNNLPFQVFYQSFLSRSFAWTQKAFRQVGFREIQDMYPSLYYLAAMGNAPLAKTMISEWVKNVYEYGYANHNFFWQGNGAGDCSDDQLWLIQAVYRYIAHTKDYAFLEEEYPIAGSDKKRSVIDTMKAAIDYSAKISVGKHGLPLLDHADWNDCLKLDQDSISAPYKFELYKKQLEEKGQEWGVPFENHYCESVMNAFLLKVAEDELCEMAKWTGKDSLAVELEEMSALLQNNIQTHAWKGDFFARCLINNPAKGHEYVGAGGDGLSPDGKSPGSYFLNAFSWSILANSATEEQIDIMVDRIEKYIKTEAGLMLSSPCDLGKVSTQTAEDHYYHGDRENGAVFKHATMMSTAAMFKAAKTVKSEELASKLSSLAFWMLDRVLPYKALENPYVLKGNPRFCTQYNNSETLENIGPMLSGTASWLTLTVFEFLGIGYTDGGLTFSPVLPEAMKNMHFEIKRGDTVFAVDVKKPEGFFRTNGNTKYTFDGSPCGNIIPDPADGKVHQITVEF